MNRLFLACIAVSLLLTLIPAASAQEDGYPACSESELLVLLSTLLDYVPLRKPIYDTIDDLVDYAGLHLEQRDSSFSLLPLCRSAIVTQRQVIALYGDFAGGSALDRAGASRGANPYIARDLVAESGIDRAMEDFLVAAGEDDAPNDRSPVRFCSGAENDRLDDLAAEFLSIDLGAPTAGNRTALVFIDLILAWREAKLALLPDCAEAIELGFLLSRVTTDAAAMLAFGYAGVPETDNPYAQPVAQARESLSTWRQDLKIIQPHPKGAAVLALGPASELPPCNSVEIAYAHSSFLDEVMSVAEIVQDFESPGVMIDFGNAHIDLRDGTLARFPLCDELFEISWKAQDLLDANAAFVSYRIWGYSPDQNPFTVPVLEATSAFLDWSAAAADYLREVDGIVGPAPDEREVAACSSGEISFMISYLNPDFQSFVLAGLGMKSNAERPALFERSYALQERLWLELPRCQEALEIGLLMRKIAGDWMSMLAVDSIMLQRDANPYVEQVQSGLDRFLEMKDALVNATDGTPVEARSGKTYYVTANPYANIRSCASTSCGIVTTAQNGEALSVVDDAGEWYELRLDDGRTGFIAGFLMSATRPGS